MTLLAKLRPDTDIAGLYLSGQDIFMAGFMGKALRQLTSYLTALCSGMVDHSRLIDVCLNLFSLYGRMQQ